jgi:hypothetical protein
MKSKTLNFGENVTPMSNKSMCHVTGGNSAMRCQSSEDCLPGQECVNTICGGGSGGSLLFICIVTLNGIKTTGQAWGSSVNEVEDFLFEQYSTMYNSVSVSCSRLFQTR